jgi:predicted transcriptional regulator of viral defense system
MNLFSDYIKELRASGRRHFTLEDGIADLGITRKNLLSCISRLKKRREIFSPAKGLYIIIPPEHYNLGAIPAAEIIPILMQYWQISYYVGLTTAAMYHGASHQKPQVFQIVTNKQISRQLIFGKIKIECIYKKSLAELPIKEIIVETGYLKVSSAEVTAMDLLLYSTRSGGLNHIATILTELIEEIDPTKLITLINKIKEKAWVQRLGYILDKIEALDEIKKHILLKELQKHLNQEKLFYLPLAPEVPILGALYCKKWMIIENAKIESDL